MPRGKRKVVVEEPETGTSLSEREEVAFLKAQNERLEAELGKWKPKRKTASDGSVTFKSPWPGFEVILKRASYLAVGLRNSIIVNPITAKFQNQVLTLRPADTFDEINSEGQNVRVSKIERMREIYQDYVRRRKRPPFIEVTEDTDLKIQSFRQRIPPSALVEFKGPLVELPAIPPPPPPEARETIDTMERRRPLYGR